MLVRPDLSPIPDRQSMRETFPILMQNRAGKLLIINFKARVFPCAQYSNPDIKSVASEWVIVY